MHRFNSYITVRNRVNDLFVNVHKPHVIRKNYFRAQNSNVDIYPTFDTSENAQMYNPTGYVKKVVVSRPGQPICDLSFPLRYVVIPAGCSEYDAKNIARASYVNYIYTEYDSNCLSVIELIVPIHVTSTKIIIII